MLLWMVSSWYRHTKESSGGGLAVFAKDRWCNLGHITVKEQPGSKDNDMLAVSGFSEQTQHPQALLIISGDFNQACLSFTLPTFIQVCHLPHQ